VRYSLFSIRLQQPGYKQGRRIRAGPIWALFREASGTDFVMIITVAYTGMRWSEAAASAQPCRSW